MIFIRYGWGLGFAVIMGLVLIAVIIYTIIKVRKQAREAEAAEKKAREDGQNKIGND